MKKNEIKLLLVIIFLGLLESGCGDGGSSNEGPAPVVCNKNFELKGDRLLGIDILNPAETGIFDEDIAKGKAAGMQVIGNHILWTELEDNNGSGAASGNFIDPPVGTKGRIQAFIDTVQANNLKFALTIRPIDLTGKTVPEDLKSSRFNESDFKTRFKALLTFVLNIKGSDGVTTIQNYLTSLQIGNEIDGYDTSGEHPDFWSDYGNFLAEMNAHVKTINSNIKVGFTAMQHGVVTDAKKPVFRALADCVDVIGITYYPQDDNFNVHDPEDTYADLQKLVDTFKDKVDNDGKIIYLQEVGYQSSDACNSSTTKQAEFYCAFFQAWDEQKDYIKLAFINRMNDISETKAAEMALPYGIAGEAFKEYLRTLGIRTYPGKGTDKEAYTIIAGETKRRGW